MNKLNDLKAQLDNLNSDFDTQKTNVKKSIQLEYNKVFEDSEVLRNALANLARSEEYGLNENSEVFSFIALPELETFEDCQDYLEDWLSNECVRVDWENKCLMYMQGGSLIVNHEGDVYDTDSGDTVIEAKQYGEDEGERDRLIEAWMETNGYFPQVFSVDYHNNVLSVDTAGK